MDWVYLEKSSVLSSRCSRRSTCRRAWCRWKNATPRIQRKLPCRSEIRPPASAAELSLAGDRKVFFLLNNAEPVDQLLRRQKILLAGLAAVRPVAQQQAHPRPTFHSVQDHRRAAASSLQDLHNNSSGEWPSPSLGGVTSIDEDPLWDWRFPPEFSTCKMRSRFAVLQMRKPQARQGVRFSGQRTIAPGVRIARALSRFYPTPRLLAKCVER